MTEQPASTLLLPEPAPAAPEPTAGAPRDEPRKRPRRRTSLLAGAALVAVALGSGFAGAEVALLRDTPAQAPVVAPVAAAPASAAAPTEGLARVAAAVSPSVVSIVVTAPGSSGEGSGVILRSDGTILTNNHVVESAASGGQISVRFADGRTAQAEILGRDPSTDLAVIKAQDVSGLTPATLGSSDDVHVGDTVLAIGSPLGLDGSVSAGIVSALHRSVQLSASQTLSDAIQTDAPINPGNSGGALVDASGRVVGINSAIATLGSGLGGQSGNIGVGFAIPIDEASRVADALIAGKQPTRAVLGVQASDSPSGGAVLGTITPSSAAARAGLQTGDVIVQVDDTPVTDAATLTAAVRAHQPADEVRVTYLRDNARRTTTATLGEG